MHMNFKLLQEVQQRESVPMIERVVSASVVRNQERIVDLNANCSAHEEIRQLVEHIFLPRGKSATRFVAFAGLDSGECCSRMIAEVALTLAQTRAAKTCLVDAYSHSPSLSEFFGLKNPSGLIQASRLGSSILDFTVPVRNGNLSLLPWGSPEAGAPSYLALDQVKKWLDGLGLKFYYVLVNAPPLDRFAEGIAFGQLADGLVPVFDWSSAEPGRVLKHLQRLRESRVRVCVTVLTYTHFGKADANTAMQQVGAAS